MRREAWSAFCRTVPIGPRGPGPWASAPRSGTCDTFEYFHDHVRTERIAFDGVLEPEPGGVLRPDRSRHGLGLEVRWADLEDYRVG